MRRLMAAVWLAVVVSPLSAATLTWTGSASQNWSDAGNWSPAGPPAPGDDLVFPAGAPLHTTNDLGSPFTTGSLTIGAAYTIDGSPLVVNGGITSSGGSATFDTDVAAGATQTITTSSVSLPVVFNGSFDVNGMTVTCKACTFNGPLSGSGRLTTPFSSSGASSLQINAPSNPFTGTIAGSSAVTLRGSVPDASLSVGGDASGLTVIGEPTTGDLSVTATLDMHDIDGVSPTTIHCGSLQMVWGFFVFDFQTFPVWRMRMNAFTSDRIDVHGTVTLDRAYLNMSSVSSLAPLGHVYTIIDNDGTDPVRGQFGGSGFALYLNEGDIVQTRAGNLRISYFGGDGNDVTLTVVEKTASSVTLADPGPTVFGQPVTFNMSLNPATVTGNVTISVDGQSVATVPLVYGYTTTTATWTTSQLTAGTHTITASYSGDANNAPSSSTVTHVVAQSETELLGLASDVATASVPLNVAFRVAPVAPGSGTPAGTMTFSENGTQLASVPVSHGAASAALTFTATGHHTITVRYSGDENFHSSSKTLGIDVVSLAVSGTNVVTAEGNDGTHVINVPLALSAPASGAVTVTYHTENGTATAGEDYATAAGTVTIPAGAQSASIPVTIFGDTKPELDETLYVVLDHVSDGEINGARIRVTISNDDPTFTRTSGIAYDGTHTLDILTPLNPMPPLPAVLAFVSHDDESFVDRETARGYAVVVVSTSSTFPQNLADARAALQWLRANAATYGIDPHRIGAWGIGAGGNLASLLGTTGDPRVSAVVDWYGEVDYVALAQSPGSCAIDYTPLFGCNPAVCPDVARGANPALQASSGDAPFLIVHGSDDCAVPITQSATLRDALIAAGVPAQLITVNGAGHGGDAFADDSVLGAVDAFLDRYVGATARPRPGRH
jgi:dienelactone hydrolase